MAIDVQVLDAFGFVVHSATQQPSVTIDVQGPGALLGMGNGDPKDHTPEGRTGGNVRRVSTLCHTVVLVAVCY